jgi:ethanolamine permease
MSVFGALTLYIISMISLLRLRKEEPALHRPFRVPMYPLFPLTALVIALVSFIAMAIYNTKLTVIYCLLVAGCYGIFKLWQILKGPGTDLSKIPSEPTTRTKTKN